MDTTRLEASVTHSILTQLNNLGWVVDEKNPNNNVTQQRPKTEEQKQKLKGKMPDFVLYQQGTSTPIGVIEAKKPNESLIEALNQAEERYAKPLNVPLIFAYNDTYVATRYLYNEHTLKIDGEDVRQFVDHHTSLRFVQEGPEILSAPPHVQYSREQLITVFKKASNLLREAGLQAGLERFGAFSDILFLKIMDEICGLRQHAGEEILIPDYIRWSFFKDKNEQELYKYVKDVVWNKMNDLYGTIFSESLPIDSPEILHEIVDELSNLNLTASDTDVKGDAFEYFLKNAYQGLSIKDLGEYFTPRDIVRTMVSMVDPKIGEKIYDPFCGTGGFLIESFKYLKLRLKSNKTLEEQLKTNTVWGSEITSTARIAKMNMILFGDGHSNIKKEDSLKNPKTGKFDIVLTNPPYSIRTRYGNLYPIPSNDGDALCMMHCYDSLNENGRAAILVKENFLSDGGDIGQVRDYLVKTAKNFSVVSLPRKLFIPYTPTKTSIVYFEKAGKRDTTFFYIVKKVGHTLSARKKTIRENDLPTMLDAFNEDKVLPEIDSWIVNNEIIKKTDNSLWPYDYHEEIPPSHYPMKLLGDFIEESGEMIRPSDFPAEEFSILGVSNKVGVFENEIQIGGQVKQKYKKVNAGELVYNPHRVNVGSIGVVPKELDGGYVSGIYVVFKTKNENVLPDYVLTLLKSPSYRKVIEAYDTKYGAVRANLNYEQLCRIRIPVLPTEKRKEFVKKQREIEDINKKLSQSRTSLDNYINEIVSKKEEGLQYIEDLNTLLERAVKD